MTAVHQLLPVYSPGDAIGIATERTQSMLRDIGFTSDVYADVYDQRVSRGTRHSSELAGSLAHDDTLIYHLSIGSRAARLVAAATCRRILVYHNITPERYFEKVSARVTYMLRRGRQDLARLAPVVDLVIADSEFNATEAIAAGARRTVVIPPPMNLERLHPAPALPASPPSVLFVGRLAPNKCQHDLVRALAVLRAGSIPGARLTLAGAANDTGPYALALRRLASELGVADAVDIPAAHLDDAELGDQYRRASVYACASEHEGFCVPLVEAMAFRIPIVAFNAAAVPGTLGSAGLLVSTKDPVVWAVAIERLIRDGSLRSALGEAGAQRLRQFSVTRVRERLVDALAGIGVVP